MAAVIWPLVGVVCVFVAVTQSIPVDHRNNENDFVSAFDKWLTSSEEFNGELVVDSRWPEVKVTPGQIGGVASNEHGDAVVFHRAGRKWDEDSFKGKIYNKQDAGPIMEPTVMTLNRSNGAVLNTWGQNLFYLPHGLTIDHEGNHWVTDVALHQVFKFGKDKTVPELTVGKQFEPASNNDDMERFCKPTDVAVAKNGDFFVSDGYCNSRVVKYSKDGTLIGVLGQDNMRIPHSLALVEDMDLICVADREDKRILCYDAGLEKAERLGEPVGEFVSEQVMGRVFAISYSETDGLLYAVTAPTDNLPGSGFTIDLHDKDAQIIAMWAPKKEGFDMPHDLDVTRDGASVYVGEIGPNNIWKFGKN